MKLSNLTLSLSAFTLTAVAVFAAQDKTKPAPEPQMPPAPKPGPQHKIIERKVGTWDATFSIPGAPPSTDKAVYIAKMDCGGLWLIGDYRGTFMGGSFVGHEVEGYDTKKAKYVSTWVDSMMDHIMAFEGDWDGKTQTMTMFTDSYDMTGKPIKERHDTKFIDADTWVFTMNSLGTDGKYSPTMTVNYERKL